MNEARKFILKAFDLTKNEKKSLMGKFKYVLAKRAAKRNEWERQSLAEAGDANKLIIQLEMIKESVQICGHLTTSRMHQLGYL